MDNKIIKRFFMIILIDGTGQDELIWVKHVFRPVFKRRRTVSAGGAVCVLGVMLIKSGST